MTDTRDVCAGCGCSLHNARELGSSSVYNPKGLNFDLCMPCWNSEEALIEEDGNFQPTLLTQYYATFGLERPKLYDVLKDAWV